MEKVSIQHKTFMGKESITTKDRKNNKHSFPKSRRNLFFFQMYSFTNNAARKNNPLRFERYRIINQGFLYTDLHDCAFYAKRIEHPADHAFPALVNASASATEILDIEFLQSFSAIKAFHS